MEKIVIYFKKDLGRPLFVPHYYFKTSDHYAIYDCIMDRTRDHDLSANVASWAEVAGIGEEYDCDELNAEIVA